MGLFDLFRPKWRHSAPEVRQEAVKQLSPVDDAQVLARIVTGDPDARVRRVALKKLDDWDLLGEVAEHDSDETIRRDAREKAAELLLGAALSSEPARAREALAKMQSQRVLSQVAERAALPELRREALARLDEPKALAEVARKSRDVQMRRAAVERLSEPAVLREVAIGDDNKDVALAAVTRLDDAAELEQVLRRCKQWKAVRQVAKQKLDARARPEGEGPATEKQRRGRQALLCRQLEQVSASSDWDRAIDEIAEAQREWTALGRADESLGRRFERAVARFQSRREERERELREEAARARAVVVEEQIGESVREERQRKSRETRAEEERETGGESGGAATGSDAASGGAGERLRGDHGSTGADAEGGGGTHATERDEERSRRDADRARRQAERDEERVRRDQERIRREAEAAEGARRLGEITMQLEALATVEDRKRGDKALKDAQAMWQSLGPLPREQAETLRARFQAARGALHARVQELREADDWRRWANVPRLEGLCARVEALAAAADPELDLAKNLKALQDEWKEVGGAPKDASERLWARFKAAGDQVFERVRATRATEAEERKLNLARKEELAVRAGALADAENFKETAETIKALQEEWKAIGPAPRAEGEAVWKRFRGACDRFFERRQAHFAALDRDREGNLGRQEELCARVEALARAAEDASGPEQRRIGDEIKAAQAEWKTIGPAPKDKAESVWQRFRGACDQFFEQRKAHLAKLDEERAQNLKAKEALVGLAEGLVGERDRAKVASRLNEIEAQWEATGEGPRGAEEEVGRRFRVACEKAMRAEGEGKGTGKFENRLPLEGVLEKLGKGKGGE